MLPKNRFNLDLVGGTTPAARNVISNNSATGAWIWWAGNNTIQGNYIGTDYTGTLAIGNGWCGVTIFCANNLVGGTQPGAGNLITNNGLSGIEVTFDNCTGNEILGNSIYNNGRLPIDLNNDGVIAERFSTPVLGCPFASQLQNRAALTQVIPFIGRFGEEAV